MSSLDRSVSTSRAKVSVSRDDQGAFFSLATGEGKEPLDVRVGFERRGQIGLRTDLLARAIGFKKNNPLRVFDATAGLCRDSFHFFCLGCQVLAIEAQPILFEVVSEQLARQVHSDRLKLIRGDAVEFLTTQAKELSAAPAFDVIYLDPIFAHDKSKSARSGKESELLRALAAEPDEAADQQLLVAALAFKGVRVVVKRPLRAKEISVPADGKNLFLSKHSIKGAAIRYDVYTC